MGDKLSSLEWLPDAVDSSAGASANGHHGFSKSALISALRYLRNTALNAVFPHTCPVCDVCLQGDAGLCLPCWQQMDLISPPFCERLGTPLYCDLGPNAWSAAALVNPPDYARARAAALYNGPARTLVRQFKFNGQPKLARFLAHCMLRASRELVEAGTILIPVPLHRARLRQRTYNQAALLAYEIGKAFGCKVIADGLSRTRKTIQQVGLKRAARAQNVKGAFAISDQFMPYVSGAHIVLVDDVLTTGATVEECTRILKSAGARQVDVLVFALVDPEHGKSDSLG
ncbi:ComF family protein [Pseudovibrio sp. Tun.PSC04-5.I4]|uniref:ComF family protein n=1 Tax=Pseudovibrio sp. Tun.PSC04-5.I4 TaxID=1798213 RepID=UPI00088B916B|nr:ComF family protein [Pseudovibrio sp. Tun.PSC04-5.I4]SDR29368.1 comF family protein [Pseudovibrio sp. Tun.PSC04-5.I4]